MSNEILKKYARPITAAKGLLLGLGPKSTQKACGLLAQFVAEGHLPRMIWDLASEIKRLEELEETGLQMNIVAVERHAMAQDEIERLEAEAAQWDKFTQWREPTEITADLDHKKLWLRMPDENFLVEGRFVLTSETTEWVFGEWILWRFST
jgi:hypothetical protein